MIPVIGHLKRDATQITSSFDDAETFLAELSDSKGISIALENHILFSRDELPYYTETEELQQMLLRYIDLSLKSIMPKAEGQDQRAYDAAINRYKGEKTHVQNDFSQKFGATVFSVTEVTQQLDGTEVTIHSPMIINIINAKIFELAKQAKVDRIRTVFTNESSEALAALSPVELAKKYNETLKFKQLVDSVNQNFRYLASEKTGLHVPIDVYFQSSVSGVLKDFTFTITVTNEAIGYSIHTLLIFAELIPSGSIYHGITAQGNVFQLSYEEFLKLKDYLSDLCVWLNDFSVIFSALLGEDSEQYVQTGHKPLSEIIKTEEERAKKRLPLFINPEVTKRLKQMDPSQKVLLFSQPAINLTPHENREELKDLIEWIYQINNLQDSKKDRKTFIVGSPGYEFISLLSIEHIRLIFNDLMYLVNLTASAREMGFQSPVSSDFLRTMELSDARQLFHRVLFERLIDTNKMIELGDIEPAASRATFHFYPRPSDTISEETAMQKHNRITRKMAEQFVLPKRDETLSQIYERFNTVLGSSLDEHAGIICRRMTRDSSLEVSDAEKQALFPSRPG